MIKILRYIGYIITGYIVFCCFFAITCQAEGFKISSLFSDNMILQQNEPIRIWGTSDSEGSTVTAVMGKSVGSSKVHNGQWEIQLAARCYTDAPATLEVYDSEGEYESFENILIGDVWWVLGQSNVEYTSSAADEFDGFADTISGNEKIRIVSLKIDSFEENKIRWRNFSRYSTYNSGALSSFFAKNVSDAINNEIPIAIVNMGFGGREISDFLQHGEIYKNVLSYAEKMPIAGLIWYQGESDAAKPYSYADKLTELIGLLRAKKNSDFPVYSIELPPCFNNPSESDWQYDDFGIVRGESCGIAKDVPKFYVCPTGDLWKNKDYKNNIHPNNKTVTAQRLALMVVSKEYAFGGEEFFFAPAVKSIDYEGNDRKKVVIEFANTGEGLKGDKKGFVLLNDDFSEIRDFTFFISGKDKIILSADENISVVRYGTATDSTFPEKRSLSSSYNVPSAAFSYMLFRHPADTLRRYILLTLCIGSVFISIFVAVRKGKK